MSRTALARDLAAVFVITTLWAGPGFAEKLPGSFLPTASMIQCAGNEQVDVADRHLRSPADAVQAHGNCKVRLSGVHVLAGGTAVLATGNAEIVIDGSFVQGGRQAVKVTGNAVVRYRDSTLRGAIFAAAGGRAEDGGGNSVEDLPRPPSAPLTPMVVLSCGDRDPIEREQIALLHRGVDVPADAFEVGEGCELTLSDSYVRAGGWGLRIARGGKATVRNSVIEAGAGGIEVADGGYLHIAGSSIPGGVHRLGSEAVAIDGGGNAWSH